MGLTIHYTFSLPAETPETVVHRSMAALREAALALPFVGVTDLVRLTREDLARTSPIDGEEYFELADVVMLNARFVAEEFYRVSHGIEIVDDVYPHVELPDDLAITVIGFTVFPGEGCELPAFALMKLEAPNFSPHWHWSAFCKTQYASAHGDEHFVKCHRALVELLDAAKRVGLECDVLDEGEYYESRDEALLLENVDKMNRLVAHFAGRLSDMFEERTGDSRRVQGEIFRHPDFERLETRGPDLPGPYGSE
jgi:hypothetical protein